MHQQSKGPLGGPAGGGGGSSPSQRIGSALLYAVASFGITIVNKEVLTVHKFPSFQCLAWGQMVATVLIMYTAKKVGLLSFPDLRKGTFRKIWPLPLLFLGNALFGLASTKTLSLPMFTALRRFAILLTMIAEYLILGIEPSIKVQVAVYMMIFGAIVAACDDFSYTAEGYAYVLLTNIFNAMQGVYVKKKLDSQELGTYGLTHYNSFFLLIPTFLIALSMGEVDEARQFEGWINPVFMLLFLLSCVMGVLLTYSTFLCTKHNSALTTTIVGTLKNVTVTYLGMVIGGDYVFSVVNFIGLNSSIVGSLFYTWVVFGEKSKSSNAENMQNPEVPSQEKSPGKLHEENGKTRRSFEGETLRLSALVILVLTTATFIFLLSGSGVHRQISNFSPGAAQRSKLMLGQLSSKANAIHTPNTEYTAAVEKTTLRSEKEIKLFNELRVVEESTQNPAWTSEKTLAITTTRTFEVSPSIQNTGNTTGGSSNKVKNSPSIQSKEVTTVANLIAVTNSHETKLTTVKEFSKRTTVKAVTQSIATSKMTVVDNVTHTYYQTMQKLARTEQYFCKNFSYLQYTSIHKNVVPVKGFEISVKDIHEVSDSRLFDITDFKYIINNDDFCPPAPETPFVIVVVHTAIENLDKRNGIRQSWGLDVPVLFFLGATADAAKQRRLLEEDAQYHDLVQGSFMDTYHNLTYKHAMVLKWTLSHCPRVRYLVKMDDDSFLNVPYLMGTLHDLSGTGVLNLLAGYLYVNGAVLRYGKWGVSKEEYAADTYPTYCNGWLILYSLDVALSLYKESFKHKYFWIDDAFITGFLAKPLDIKHSEIGATIHGEEYGDPQKIHILAGLPLNGEKIIKMTKHYNNYTSSLLNELNKV